MLKAMRMLGLKEVIELAAKLEWQAVLNATQDDRTLARQPRLFALRLEAALELNEEEIVESTCASAATSQMSPPIRFATIRPLVNAQRAKEAWAVLTGDPEARENPNFEKHAHRVARLASATDPETLRLIRGTLRKPSSSTVPKHESDMGFPLNEATCPRALGSVSMYASAGTNLKHLFGLRAEHEELLSTLSKPRPPSVREFHNVFVDRYGQTWSEDGTRIKSHGKPVVTASKEDCQVVDVAISGLLATKGIYHWIVDRTPHFGSSGNHDQPTPKILLATNRPRFERESIELAGFADDDVVEVSDVVFVERLISPIVGFLGLREWQRTGAIYEEIAASALAKAKLEGFRGPDFVYISRRDSVRRPLENELDVEHMLAAQGFTSIQFGGLPLWQQIAIAASAKRIIAPHGAGLAHIVFARPSLKVLEILPIMDGAYLLRFNYARLSTVLGLDYTAWLEPQPPQTDHWRVVLSQFSTIVQRWLAQ
jgi:hypothetical protein